MINERKLTRQFLDTLNEANNNPDQFTGAFEKIGKEAGSHALSYLPGSEAIGSIQRALKIGLDISKKAQLEKNFPSMEIAGFVRACMLFSDQLARLNQGETVETLFNDCLKKCNVTRYSLSDVGSDAGQFPAITDDDNPYK